MSKVIEQRRKRWLDKVDGADRAEILGMDDASCEDAFCRDLSFGTGGLRGRLGQGPSRMNIHTVGRATQGLADYLNEKHEKPVVAINRDTRHGSEAFARRTAEVLAGNEIKSVIFERPEPTPALSFAVRELGCSAGVSITASHNPADYNGYKVYGPDGCQATVAVCAAVQEAMGPLDPFDDVRAMPYDEAVDRGLALTIGEPVLDRYVALSAAQSTGEDLSGLRVAYTPLHGVGLECVSRALTAAGVRDLCVVGEQAAQDGDFPTCPRPNPEEPGALRLGIELCEGVGADILLATDPDCDRLRVAVRHAGGFVALSGDELGLLLLDHAASCAASRGEDVSRKVAFATVVTHPMADDLARAHGFELRRTLTGFKYIGEQVGLLEAQGREGDFLIGVEESLGYLTGTHVRDKCGVVSCVLACCLAARWGAEGLDLVEAMGLLYGRHGHWAQRQVSREFEGGGGAGAMSSIMRRLREGPPAALAGLPVERVIDYARGAPMPVVNPSGPAPQALPPSDALELRLAGGSRAVVRPSGTEPKAKAYLFARSGTREGAESLLRDMSAEMDSILGGAE